MKRYRVTAIIVRHFYEAKHNVDRVIDMVYWPVLDIIFFGLFTLYLTSRNQLEPSFVSFLLGAVILWGTFYAFQRDMVVGFLDELWSRNVLNLFVTPLNVWEYLIGLVAVNLVKISVGLFITVLLAWALYAFHILSFAILFIPLLFNLLLFGLAIGVFVTALVFRYTTKIQTLAWSFAALLQPISCTFYPLATLPSMLQPVAWMLPTTHVFEGMRQVLAGGGLSVMHFWWGLALSIGYLLLAIFFFWKIFEIVKQRGLLVKIED